MWSRTHPSTGVIAVWTALSLCSRVSLVGFGGCAGEDASRLDTYYNVGTPERQAQYEAHDMQVEWAWLRELARIGVVEWAGCGAS